MIKNIKKTKTITLSKSKKIWQSSTESVFNAFDSKNNTIFNICFKLPEDFDYIEQITFDGKIVWENKKCKYTQSGPIGNGGRFYMRRRFMFDECVSQQIEFRDIKKINNVEPLIKIVIKL